jgi:adenylate cyclase
MADDRAQKKLAAILVADVVGYSRLMEQDEAGTLAALKLRRTEILKPLVAKHRGRVVKVMGDGVLVEFASAGDAVACAMRLQADMAAANAGLAEDRQIVLRVGLNLGDVIVEGGDLYVDGVNIAARLQQAAEPGEICLSAKVHDEVRGKLGVAFEDLGHRALKNIAAPVRVFRIAGATPPHPPALPMPDKPSVAVLPFANLSGDSGQEHVADGLGEELTAALSRVRSLFVIAGASTVVYRTRAATPPQIGRELGVQYLIEGSLRADGQRLRIAARLIDAATGSPLWADRYEGARTDIFDLQDRIAESVVGAIQPSILIAEIERSRRKRPANLAAYDLVLRAFPLAWSLERSRAEQALALLDRALEIEPEYPMALSLAAWCHAQAAVYNWTDALGEARRQALALARRAAAISRDDPMVLAVLGAACTVARDLDAAEAHLERAVALDPNSAWGWQRLGWLNVHRERAELAIEHFERSGRLSPFDPMVFINHLGIGSAQFAAGRYEASVTWLRKALGEQPEWIWSYRVLVPALSLSGRTEEARQACRVLMDRYPGLTIAKVREALPFGPGMMERVAAGLREECRTELPA